METRILTALVIGAALVTVGYPAQAELQGRNLDGDPTTFEAYYDTVLNITWLADANYAATQFAATGGALGDEDGHMNWVTAKAWAEGLNYHGITGWRLPKVIDTGAPGCDFSYHDTDCGYNVQTASDGVVYSELAHLWYITLENKAFFDTSGGRDQPGYGFTSKGPFINAQDYVYWSGTEALPPPAFPGEGAWSFYTMSGYYAGVQSGQDRRWDFYSWPVHDGDVAPPVLDSDGDGVPDNADNCPEISNPDQTDNEADGIGDVCDADDDNDGLLEPNDNCPLVGNASQTDADGDGLGDVCDGDLDGDGYDNSADNCPMSANSDQTDTDADGEGDECDLNDDGDAFPDAQDNCPSVPNDSQEDLDADGIGDFCDADLDGDGVANEADNCAIDPNVGQDDADGDGAGDVCDTDDDADGVSDDADNCRLVANPDQSDIDADGTGDACDTDLDGDGTANGADNCPQVANPDQRDMDDDGIGDACDPDVDGDGVANAADACAGTPAGVVIDSTGCSIAQLVPCAGPAGTVMPWRNHGKYVSAVAQAVKRFLEAGLLTQAEADNVVSSAAGSSCGR